MSTVSDFPTSPTPNRLVDLPPEHQRNVIWYEYEDGSIDCNVQPCALKKWQLSYEGLDTTDFDTMMDHFVLARGKVDNFSFTHLRDGLIYSGVTYADFKIGKHPKYWVGMLEITLQKFL